MFIDTPVSLAT